MRKRVRVLVATAVVIGLSGTAAVAIALPAELNNASVITTTTSTTQVAVEQPAETVEPTTTTAPAQPTTDLKAAQQKLNDLGYWVGSPDGKAGQLTQQALFAFQKIQGLPKSGTLDAATNDALQTATRPAPSSITGDLIEVDKTRQVIFIVRGGQTQWVFNTSTGTEKSYVTNGNKGFAHTPTGTFKVSRVVDAVDPGPLGDLYRPRYFTNTGIAIHGAAGIPATPASHGCARVSNAAMDFIWANNLMPQASLVWVYEDPAKQPFSPTISPTTTSTTAAPTTTSTTAPTTTSTTVSSTTSSYVPPTTPTTESTTTSSSSTSTPTS